MRNRCTGVENHDGDCANHRREYDYWLKVHEFLMTASEWEVYQLPRRCTLTVGKHPLNHHPDGDGSGK